MNQQSAAMPNEKIKTPAYAWVVLVATYLASLAAPLNLFKVPPMLTTLQPIFNLSQSEQGQLMSVFSIMGFVLAIPAGFILKRFGIKLTVLGAVAALAIGAGLGALSETWMLLFFGRFIEGAGMGLIMVSAPLAISLWFPADKRGLPMGLWASCIGVGNTAMFILAPKIAAPSAGDPSQVYQWPNVWWTGAIFAAISFVIFAIFFRLPKAEEMADPPAPVAPGSAPEAPPSLVKAMANRNLWLLSIAFLTFNLVIMALNTFFPVYLEVVRGYTKEGASSTSSLLMFIAIFSAPLGSFLSDKLKSRKLVIVIPFVIIAGMFFCPFSIEGAGMIQFYLIVMGIMMGPVAPIILAAVPETMPSPQTIGIGMGVAALGQNLGMYIGPVLFGYLLESVSWQTTGYVMIPICLIGIIAALMAKVR
ncbi:MAG: MFS transporter [Acidobacteriota bacterium]